MMEQLRKTRENWLQAYYQGNIAELKNIEASGFICVSGQGIEAYIDRYSSIEAAISAGTWPKNDGTEELSIEYLPNENSCVIYGLAQIMEHNGSVANITFSENWFRQGNSWKIQCLHISRMKHNVLPLQSDSN